MSANYSTPAATLVTRANAPRADWLAARGTGLGASDASKVLGISPYGDALTVWAEKTGRAPEREDNEAMYWGRAIEPLIRTRFTEDTGIQVRQSGMLRSKEHPHLLYTPDGLTADGGIFEAKTFGQWVDGDWWNDDGTESVPDLALAQVQQGLLVTGRSHAWVCGLGSGRTWYVRRVEPMPDLQDLILDATAEVWQHIQDDTEPPAGRSSAPLIAHLHPVGREVMDLASGPDGPALRTVRAALAEYRDAAKAEKEAKARKDIAANVLRQVAGDASDITLDGIPGYTYRNTGRFNPTTWAEATTDDARRAATDVTVSITRPATDPDLEDLITRAADLGDVNVTRAVNPGRAEEADPEAYTAARPRVLRLPR